MSSPRHPSRLAQYVEGEQYYPRELTESDGNLYLINEDGSKTHLNPEATLANTTIKDSAGTTIGTVNPKSGGNITVPDASSSKRGFALLSDTAAKAPASTAAAGTATTVSRSDHVHPVQTSVSGNAGTATKLKTPVNIGLSGVTATAQQFDGSKDINIPITAVPASIITGLAAVATSGSYNDLSDLPTLADVATSGSYNDLEDRPSLATVATSGSYNDLSNKPTIYQPGTAAPAALGTAAVGTSTKFAREDHVHAAPTAVTGNAGTATKLKTPVNIGITGVTATAASFDGSEDVSIAITAVPATIVTGLASVATSGNYSDLSGKPTIYQPGTATPKGLGTAAVGTSTAFAREDHVHAAPTTVSGNAGSATKLATARSISVTGAVTGAATKSFDGSDNITINTTSLDATKLTGTIPMANLPQGALERLVIVANDTARLALTSSSVQNGDVVKVTATGLMYFVADDSKLGTEAAFEGFTAGTASAVDWSGITNKPNFATVATSGSYNDLVNLPTFATVATSGRYSDLSDKPTIYQPATAAPAALGTAAVGTSTKFAREDHVHTLPTIYQPGTTTPKGLGTAAVGTSTKFAREDHVHAAPTAVTGNAGTATKLKTPVDIGITGVTATAASFDGSEDVSIEITAVPATIVTGLATVATSGSYSDLSNKPTIYAPSDTTPKAIGTAAAGSATTFSRSDHVHALPTNIAASKINGLTASRALISNSSGVLTVSAVTSTELGYLDGVTSAIQTQLNGKAASSHNHDHSNINGLDADTVAIADEDGVLASSAVTTTELGYLSGVTSAIQTQLNGKAASSHGTHVSYGTTTAAVGTAAAAGSATTVSRSDNVHALPSSIAVSYLAALTASRAVVTDTNGKLTASAVTSTELGYLDGVTSAIQTQLDGKAASSHGTHVSYGTTTAAVSTAAAAGSATTVSRSDHVHALPTNIAASKINGLTASRALVSNSSGVVTVSAVTSTELGYLDGVTSAIQTQLNGKATTVTYTASVGTTWTGSEAPYTQTITVSGITANDNPIVDVVLSSDFDTASSQLTDYGKIYRITTAANSITVYASETTEAAVSIQLKCVR